MRILSIQSSVAYGHAGNSSAVFPLQRLGHEVWAVNTVHFSNHTGYGAWRGPLLDPADVADVITGIEERGVLPTCDAVLTGYQGGEAVGEVVLEAVAKVRAANPRAVYCCDPVMGDVGRGFFVRPGIPELMRDRVVPAADVVTPNQFELEFLTGREPGAITTTADLLAAVDELHAAGPSTVLVTSVQLPDAPGDTVSMLASDGRRVLTVTTPLLPLSVNGAGDATAAIFLAHLLTDGLDAALARTAASVFGVLEATVAAGHREIRLIDAQDEIASPSTHFDVVELRAS